MAPQDTAKPSDTSGLVVQADGGPGATAGGKVRAGTQRPTRETVGAVVMGLVLVVALVMLVWPARSGDPNPKCLPAGGAPNESSSDPQWARYNHPSAPELPSTTPSPWEAKLATDQRTVLKMGRAKEVRALDVDYAITASDPDPVTVDESTLPLFLRVEVSQLTRTDGSDLDERKVWATARLVAPDRVRISLCVDRRDLTGPAEGSGILGQPGQYTGVVSVIDPRMTRTDLPVTVTLSYAQPWFVFGVVLLAALAGLVVAWVVHTKVEDDRDLDPSALAAWVVTTTGALSLAAGTFVAVQSFRASYLVKETWGEDLFGDLLALVGTSFSAFVGATASLKVVGLAATVKSRPGRPPHDEQEEDGESGSSTK